MARTTEITPLELEGSIVGTAGFADPKPGWKTTECWLTLLAQLVGAFAASGIVGDGHWAMRVAGVLSMALAGMGYTWSRGKVKAR